MNDALAEFKKEQMELRKRVEHYAERFIKFKDLENLEKKLIELDARITKLEKIGGKL